MAAAYPGTIKTFSTKAPGEAIASSHINDLQNEVVAVETQLGVNAGTWTEYTPSVFAATGTLTSYTSFGRYCRIGKVVICYLYITITDNGTGSVAIITNLPVPMVYGAIGTGRENAITGDQLQLFVSGTTINITNYENAYPAVTGAVLIGSVTYEAA